MFKIKNTFLPNEDEILKIKSWLRCTYDMAKFSPDPSNQCGAVLLDSAGYEVSWGYNSFPKSIIEKYGIDYLLKDRDRKLFYIEHAERACIYKGGGDAVGGILICPWFACADCAKAMIFSEIKFAVGHKQRMEKTPERWEKSIEAALDMLDVCGVKMYFYDGPIEANVLVNGELWDGKSD